MWIVDRLKSVFATDDEEYGPLHLPPQSRVNRDRRSDIIGQYYELDSADAERIAAILAEHLNTSNYNPDEVMAEVSSVVDADSQVIKQVVTQQVRSIQNEAAIRRYTENESELLKVEWMPPGDGDISPVCEDAVTEIEARGGAVPVEELHAILTQSARNHSDGTPELMTCWVPHEGVCRCCTAPVY